MRQPDLRQFLRLRRPCDFLRIESLLLRGAQCCFSRVVIWGTFVDPLLALNRMHRRRRAVILLLVKTYRIL